MAINTSIRSVDRIRIGRVALHLGLLIGAVLMVMPFVWMLKTSLQSNSEALALPPRWIPETFIWQNYVDVLTQINYIGFFRNSLIVAALRVGGQLITCSLAAYAFARLRFPGRDILF